MKPSEALRRRRAEVLAVLRGYGVDDVRVFGSVVRGQDREGSDVDLLVRFAPGTSLLDVSSLHLALEELLGFPVEVISEAALRGTRGERIRREARRF